jgi:hypothetical protein
MLLPPLPKMLLLLAFVPGCSASVLKTGLKCAVSATLELLLKLLKLLLLLPPPPPPPLLASAALELFILFWATRRLSRRRRCISRTDSTTRARNRMQPPTSPATCEVDIELSSTEAPEPVAGLHCVAPVLAVVKPLAQTMQLPLPVRFLKKPKPHAVQPLPLGPASPPKPARHMQAACDVLLLPVVVDDAGHGVQATFAVLFLQVPTGQPVQPADGPVHWPPNPTAHKQLTEFVVVVAPPVPQGAQGVLPVAGLYMSRGHDDTQTGGSADRVPLAWQTADASPESRKPELQV